MRGYIVVVGPAGSGKSTITKFLVDLANNRGPRAIAVNLDPAAEELPYDPHVDVREHVDVKDFMRKGLGPNGALIASVASLVNYVREIDEAIEEYKPDLVFIDTPGQLELFAYRSSGPVITRTLIGDHYGLTLFLMDAPFFEDPLSIVSALSLASSVAVRMGLAQINAVTKADLLLPEVLEEVIPRLPEEGYLESLIEASKNVDSNIKLLALSLASAIRISGLTGEIIPVTIYREDMINDLYAKTLQVLFSGEEPGFETTDSERNNNA